jgi:hypothetical protein
MGQASSIQDQERAYTSAMVQLANDLLLDPDPINRDVGRSIMACLSCNLSEAIRRCDTCPQARNRDEQLAPPPAKLTHFPTAA